MTTTAPSPTRLGATPIDTRLRQERTRLFAGTTSVTVLVLLGLQREVVNIGGITVGLLAVLLLSPVWLPSLRRYRGARIAIAAGLIAIGVGLVMAGQSGGRRILPSTAAETVAYVLLVVCGAGFVLWCRRWLSAGWIGVALGTGMLLAVDTSSPRFLDDPWRFGWSVPLTIVALGAATATGRRSIQLAVVLLFAFIATFTDARSTFAMLLLTAVGLAWQVRPRPKHRALSATMLVGFGALLVVVVYQFGQALLVSGVLGEAAQARSIAQIEETGSLLLGGRPELAATAALFLERPTGMGLGVQPTLVDVHTAQAGMAHIGYNGDNGYVWNYMFGTGFELHSTAADLWAAMGFGGVLLAAVVLFALVRGTALAIAGNAASGLLLFVAIKSLWNLGFGPLDTSALPMMLALGLAIPVMRARIPRTRRGRSGRAAAAGANRTAAAR